MRFQRAQMDRRNPDRKTVVNPVRGNSRSVTSARSCIKTRRRSARPSIVDDETGHGRGSDVARRSRLRASRGGGGPVDPLQRRRHHPGNVQNPAEFSGVQRTQR